jgi:hypothetical protein
MNSSLQIYEELHTIAELCARIEERQIGMLKQIDDHHARLLSVERSTSWKSGLYAGLGGIITGLVLTVIQNVI